MRRDPNDVVIMPKTIAFAMTKLNQVNEYHFHPFYDSVHVDESGSLFLKRPCGCTAFQERRCQKDMLRIKII
jgi:hypothetical protein